MSMRGLVVSLPLLLLGSSLASQALAQAVPASALPTSALPESADPARQQDRFRIDRRPELSAQPLIESPAAEPHAPIASGSESATVVLRDVRIEGNTAIPARELEPLYRDKIGQSLDLNGLRAIADSITARYRNEGYILSRAIVPAGQQIGSGVITIRVVEGYVDTVVFQGAGQQSQSLLESYAGRIKASKPLNNNVLERYLLLMDDITGATARGVLSPSPKNTGASQLTVTIDYKAIDGNLTYDNRGSRFLGPLQYSAVVGANSLLHQSERIQLRGITTGNPDELKFIEGSYQQPVGPEGTTLRATASYTETNPGASLHRLDINGTSSALEVAARHPFLRSRRENLFGNAGFRYRDSDTSILDTELYDDHIRSVYLGASYDVLDGWQGINRIDFEAAQGIDIINANDHNALDPKSRSNADPTFTRLTGQYTRLQPLDRFFSLFGGVSGQYAFDPLFASEEFAVGGPVYGSAYDPAEITGDSGIAARAEYRYSNTAPDANIDVYQIYAFYDVGKVWNRDTLVGEVDRESLTSTGIGVRLTFLESFAANFEFAVPLTRDVAAEGTRGDVSRGFFSLSYIF